MKDADTFYTPAAGDADQYNNLGEPLGDAGPGAAPNETWQPRSPEVSGRWAGASEAQRRRLLDLAHDQALNEDATRTGPALRDEYAEMIRGFAQRTGCDSPAELRAFTLGMVEALAKAGDLDGVKAAIAALAIVLDD